MANKSPLEFATIEGWALPEKPGRLGFFEAVALAGLEGQWLRLSAKTQRETLGHAVFGKQLLQVGTDGTVRVQRSTAFGSDSESQTYDAHRIARAAEQKKLLSPGVYGPSYCSE